jgi:hypothetical protein
MNEQQYIEHEVEIRVLKEKTDGILSRLDKMDSKMDNQFKWIIGTIVTMVGGLLIKSLT